MTRPNQGLSSLAPGGKMRDPGNEATLSEVEKGVKPCRICKTFWSIRTKLICCIEGFKAFAGNWTLVLCERN